ncbi:D-alanyl-D-alanine carboxypeptidase/D-alanyl-D-alanine endopeptidase [Arthrobacter caoxuetaonis]|uniref:D-alanyl-D-alanine carboxypeptidase/D-alanyl-D-alanine-endopeptidase n=1 Tax=Arthrobacter caoxuetaonis TaxID=2886935 RepID=A0A9X1MEK5_9MICC|nr:D-alanyl-D-alanine carboxypeptidase/D-alanyl-D-alanine-endopeptidase [Arthrobacter caoxuetaonis]MCC3281693.1 D-alanyl-D-alanine carboxypeptidase/D-alanyl-D-alanine-endopeptidase [Arthrobacter caoxuetaonis]MCC3298638.1 D-alanyl-D-alanine carboxypeptidase/D-alanyl-D-alanine-endopeptidase [Arthrobacter caoxuetaonis]USQ58953.1 D-alanyl-D-alanine carboxypeptidase/D-alanyl-D-alanine-endopeptidase [Arthrobacter caoxuetaonis]
MFSGLALALAFAVLLVPLAVYAGPPLLRELDGSAVERQSVTPSYQRPPAALTKNSFVSPLDPAAPVPDPAVLAGLLDAELALEGAGSFSAVVTDALTGRVLYERNPAVAGMPASTLKVLTAAAVASALDPGSRFETTVHAAPAAAGETVVVLRGGGDVLLGTGESADDAVVGRAGLATLAQSAAKALGSNAGTVRVQVDDSFFTGPALSSAWNEADIDAGEIAPVYPLAVNSAWTDESRQGGPRTGDAAMAAAEAFRNALAQAGEKAGFSVADGVERGTVAAGARRLAVVESATVSDQIQQMLMVSDNYLAEALARSAAAATGHEPSFEGALDTVADQASALGIDTAGMVLADVSGLAAENALTARQLTDAVRLVLTSSDEGLRAVARGLPVAGLSGTLERRYDDGGAAAGLVRAKTGTLFAVTALNGYVTDADGRLLAFALVARGLDGNTLEAREAVDAAAAVLAGCGCR